ncbi:Mu-like prophage major head subunit gpT family protein [Blastochloris tepida]|uniref:Head protein n=1 Tax=Blastochloris tepida TaxID=2233851 RepID=A0A348FYI2_9HYPH|nr:Mu-like prophage major head subunit gpT family protein [Blastochloris tepida]BBF92365.1 head protein [Blastochloris tepida]
MIITRQSLGDLTTGFKASFQRGFAGVQPMSGRIATTVPSATAAEKYAWLGAWPKMREWVGERVYRNLSQHGYAIPNKEFETTVVVPRPAVEDDQYGVYSPMMEEMGRAAAAHPDELVFALLKAGFTTPCYDGQYFFDSDHPVRNPDTGADTSVSNVQSGSGNPWFLLDTSRALKPLIFQERKKPEFVTKDSPQDENVFKRNEFVYGVYARHAVGFGFWQMAFGSKAALDETNFDAAYDAMSAFKSDEGQPLGIKPTLLVVGPSNRKKAQEIVVVSRKANGADNPNQGIVEVLIVPWLD